MEKLFRYSLIVLTVIGVSGCASLTAPRYSGDIAASLQLKNANLEPVTIGAINKAATPKQQGKRAKDVDKLTIRGSILHSPYGSYTQYIATALIDEFNQAGLLQDNADTKIEGVLVRNMIDAAGVSIGIAEIELQLIVRRGGVIRYEGTKIARHEWPSSFVGAVAIPRAVTNYPIAVRKLLAEFYADEQFMAALKK
jgi:hypothetical protein